MTTQPHTHLSTPLHDLTPRSWQQELSDSVRDPDTLFELLQLPKDQLEQARAACQSFALRAPRPYLNRIAKGDLNDPLLRQILPIGDELLATPGYSQDPLDEQQANPIPGLVHKYHGRVLLIVSTNCAINCRYCFRRHFPYSDNKPARSEWQQALDYIANNPSITEVIYSGGDPLAAPDSQLRWLTEQIDAIAHVRRLRIHTRLPIMIPERINDACLSWLKATRLQTVMVIHSNHANELDDEVATALQKLRNIGVQLLNQTVLLKGVNDSVTALTDLSERLFACQVMPYYLHLLDKVQGAAHFEVDDLSARRLVGELLATLPGYLVPKLTREEAGARSKTPIPALL